MKSILLKSKSLFACGLLVMGLGGIAVAHAEEYKDSGKTTCYTFKNDKMLKKASCTYKATGEYTGNAGGIDVVFKMQGVQKSTKVGLSWYFGGLDYELNGKEGTQVLRQKSNLKKATKAQQDKAFNTGQGMSEFVVCVKEKNGNEFCYADGGIGTV